MEGTGDENDSSTEVEITLDNVSEDLFVVEDDDNGDLEAQAQHLLKHLWIISFKKIYLFLYLLTDLNTL